MKKHFIFNVFTIYISLFGTLYSQNWVNIGGKDSYSPGQRGYYDKLNQYSTKNCPYYSEVNVIWNDNNNTIYLLESFPKLNSTTEGSSMMWAFDTKIKQWKCIADIKESKYVMGQKSVPSPLNFPGYRNKSPRWVDKEGNLWLFSGGPTEGGNDAYYAACDLWKYNSKTNIWTWESGDYAKTRKIFDGSLKYETGNYITKGVPSKEAFPSYRQGNETISLLDKDSNLILFKGGESNDIWKYDIITGEWTWIAGQDPIFGSTSEYIDLTGNQPERTSPSSNYKDNGAIWLDEQGNVMLHQKHIWKFDFTTKYWTIIKKMPDLLNLKFNTPSDNGIAPGNYAAAWNVKNKELWYFGNNISNNLYVLDLVNYKWTWKKGTTQPLSTNEVSPGFTGLRNFEDKLNLPSSRRTSMSWQTGDSLFILFGKSVNQNLYDVWKYNLKTEMFSMDGGRGVLGTRMYNYKINNIDTALYYEPIGSGCIYPGLKSNFVQINKYVLNFRLNKILKTDIETGLTTLLKDVPNPIEGELNIEAPNVLPKGCFSVLGQVNNYIYIISFSNYTMHRYNLATNNFELIFKTDKFFYSSLGEYNNKNFPFIKNDFISYLDLDNNIILTGADQNEVLKFDIQKKQWAWINGTREPSNDIGLTIPQIGETGNWWVDINRDLWILNNQHHKNLLWKYHTAENKWEFIKGKRHNKPSPEYPYGKSIEDGSFSVFNYPGSRSRYGNWVDKYGNLWLYGGRTIDTTKFGNGVKYNIFQDLWMFDISAKQWVKVDGLSNFITPETSLFDNIYDNEVPITNPSNNYAPFCFEYKDNLYLIPNEDFEIWKFNYENIYPNYTTFSGTAKYDENLNGCDSLDSPFVNLKIFNLNEDEFTISDIGGNYFMFSNDLKCDVKGEFESNIVTVNPEFRTLIFSSFGENKTLDFCVQPKGEVNNISVALIPNGIAKPGFLASYDLIIENLGNITLDSKVLVKYKKEWLRFISSSVDTLSHFSDSLFFKFEKIKPFEKIKVKLSFLPAVFLLVSDSLSFVANASILNNVDDDYPNNNIFNLNQEIKSSFDPNDKQILEGSNLPKSKIGDFVTYTIRFENTGNAKASFVVLADTLNKDYFDINSIEPLDASHKFSLRTDGNAIVVLFDSIELNFPPNLNRYGYFTFRVKTKSSLSPGDFIQNSASIYFDYNKPIVTNMSEARFINDGISSTNTIENTNILVYPNPSFGVFNIVFEKSYSGDLDIFDLNMRLIQSYKLRDSRTHYLDLSGDFNLEYFVRLIDNDNTVKFIKLVKM